MSSRRERLVGLLERIERMPEHTTGALVLGPVDAPIGTILVERGRICWAATPRLQRRLTDLLMERSAHPLERALFETVYRRCRRDGRPLGEALVAADLVTRDRLREALWLHTSEAVWRISEVESDELTFVPHRHAKYDAEFSFAPSDVLCGAGRAAAGVAGPDLVDELPVSGDGWLRTLVFPVEGTSDDAALPIATLGPAVLGTSEILELGRNARASLETIGASLRGGTVAMLGPGGAGVLAFLEGVRIVVVLSGDLATAARVFAWRIPRS